MRKSVIALAAAVALAPLSVANATVYFINENVGAGSFSGTITTDDTLGVLTAANITSYTINTVIGVVNEVIDGTNTSPFVSGSGLTATATGLFFDFDIATSTTFAFFSSIGDARQICFQTTDFCALPAGPQISLQFGDNSVSQQTSARSGNYQFGRVANGAVPEPAAWAMMMLGFSAIGFGLRRRKNQNLTVRFA